MPLELTIRRVLLNFKTGLFTSALISLYFSFCFTDVNFSFSFTDVNEANYKFVKYAEKTFLYIPVRENDIFGCRAILCRHITLCLMHRASHPVV